MQTKEPYFQFITIGMLVSIWIFILYFAITCQKIDIAAAIDNLKSFNFIVIIVMLVPVFYILGLLMDQLAYMLYKKTGLIEKIKIISNCDDENFYNDEWLGYKSEFLYNEYRKRIIRTRILGAATLNWPLVAGTFAFYLVRVENKPLLIIPVGIIILFITMFSFYAWFKYYIRANKFRKKAIDKIHEISKNE